MTRVLEVCAGVYMALACLVVAVVGSVLVAPLFLLSLLDRRP